MEVSPGYLKNDNNEMRNDSVHENEMQCFGVCEPKELAVNYGDLEVTRQEVDYFPCQMLNVPTDKDEMVNWDVSRNADDHQESANPTTTLADFYSSFNEFESDRDNDPSNDAVQYEYNYFDNDGQAEELDDHFPMESVYREQELNYKSSVFDCCKNENAGFAILDTILEDIGHQLDDRDINFCGEPTKHDDFAEDNFIMVNSDITTSKQRSDLGKQDHDVTKNTEATADKIFRLESAKNLLHQDTLELEEANFMLSNELDGMRLLVAETKELQCEEHFENQDSQQEIFTLTYRVRELTDQLSKLAEEKEASDAKVSLLETLNTELTCKLEEEIRQRMALQEIEKQQPKSLAEAEEEIRKKCSKNAELQLSYIGELDKQDAWDQERVVYGQLVTEQSFRDVEVGDLVANFTKEQNRLIEAVDAVTQEKILIEKQLDALKNKLETYTSNELEKQVSLNRSLGSIHKLEIENKTLNHELIFLRKELDQLLDIKRRADDDISMLEKQKESLAEQIALLKKEICDNENVKTDLLNSNNKRDFKIAQLKYANNLVKNYVTTLTSEKDLLNRKLEKVKTQNHLLKNRKTFYKNSLENMEGESLKHKEMIRNMEEEIHSYQKIENDLRNTISQLENNFQALRDNYDAMCSESNSERMKRLMTEEKLELLVKNKNEFETILKEKDACISMLRDEQDELTNLLNNCREKQMQLETGNVIVDEQIQQIRSEFDEVKAKMENLKTKSTQLEIATNKMECENKRLQSEHTSLMAKYKNDLDKATTNYNDVCLNLEKQFQLTSEYQKENDHLKQMLSTNKRKFLSIRRKEYGANCSTHESFLNDSNKKNSILNKFTKYFNGNRKSNAE